MRLPRALLACLAFCALVAPPSRPESERILDFHSDLTLDSDGSLLVRETITVRSAGAQIRHGIFRDFPTRYRDRLGNRYTVGFRLLSADQDGTPVSARVEDRANGKRIYLGDRNALLPPGRHTYVLSYATTRQLGFFADHDELYWNVTGNGWDFPIDHASAAVRIPDAVADGGVDLDGFTGAQHSFDRNLSRTTVPEGGYFFETTAPLGPREGLSIVISWRKGRIAPPSAGERLNYFFSDNRSALLLLAGLLLLVLYDLAVWSAVGRDPARGVIFPLYEPPAGLSPAGARYLARMGFDSKVFAAAVVDMAARGFLQIREQAGSYTLYRTKADAGLLTGDEKQVAAVLFDGRDSLWLHNENHAVIGAAVASLKSRLKSEQRKILFRTNGRYLLPGVLLSLLAAGGAAYLESPASLLATGFLLVWLTIWSVGVVALVYAAYGAWKEAAAGKGSTAKALATSLFAVPFLAGECLGLVMLVKFASLVLALFLVASVLLHVLFHFLLKAPTAAGRRLLDQLAGFKMFLGAVDGDRLRRVMPPDGTPETFEKFLPYALALDVERAWSEKFSGRIGEAGRTPGGSCPPSFYSGPGWTESGACDFASSFTGAISSSSSAPGSSDGSSGGSGGGGGGGGGGGW